MNTVQVTLSMYYKIIGADLYGGPESTGYAMMAFDFDTENLGSVNLPVMAGWICENLQGPGGKYNPHFQVRVRRQYCRSGRPRWSS